MTPDTPDKLPTLDEIAALRAQYEQQQRCWWPMPDTGDVLSAVPALLDAAEEALRLQREAGQRGLLSTATDAALAEHTRVCRERDRLAGENARLRVAMIQHQRDTQAERDRLAAALLVYGTHHQCAVTCEPPRPCDCGLDAALKGQP